MDNLKIEPGKYIPGVCFDSETNIFDIKGDSYPENTLEFYAPVFSWIENYLSQLNDEEVTINLEPGYFNSSSSQILMDMFDILEKESSSGRNVIVNWICDPENEIIMEFGEDFKEDLKALQFNLVQKKG